MHITEKIEILMNYYDSTRQVGHTTLMKMGVNNFDKEKLILSYNKEHGAELNVDPKEVISWYGLDNLKRHNAPLAIDNGVMWVMLSETLEYIRMLEKSIEKLNKRNIMKLDFNKLASIEASYKNQPVTLSSIKDMIEIVLRFQETSYKLAPNNVTLAIKTLVDLGILIEEDTKKEDKPTQQLNS